MGLDSEEMRLRFSWIIYGFGYFGVGLLLTFPVYFSRLDNIDTWKNLVTGRYLYFFNQFPHYSTFTYLPVKDSVPSDVFDWLGSTILFAVYQQGGFIGLNCLKILPVLILLGLLFVLFDCRFSVYALLVGVLAVYSINNRMFVRTSMFGLICLPIMLFLWKRFLQGSQKLLWILPVVLVVWSNLHGSYQVGGFLFLGFSLGLIVESIFRRTVRMENWLTLVSVGLVTLLAVTFVKPYPDRSITNRLEQVMGKEKIKVPSLNSKRREEVQTQPTGENLGPVLRVVKQLSHDVLQMKRPYIAPEFDFTLKTIDGVTEYLGLFVLIPTFFVLWILDRFRMDFSIVGGVLFALWLGLSFNRAFVYMNLTIVFFVLIPDQPNGETRSGLVTYYSELQRWGGEVFSMALLLGFSGLLWYSIFIGEAGSNLYLTRSISGERGWGRHSGLRTQVPEFVLKDFRTQRVYNHMYAGSLLLFEWWPYKKVSWWAKTSTYPEEFLAETLNRSGLRLIRRYGANVGITTTSIVKDHELFYEESKEWTFLAADRLLHVYAKPEVLEQMKKK